MTVDARKLRDAMGCFATGITVISTMGSGGAPVGMTVNSFSSVSLEPPLVLFSLARDASRIQDFIDAKVFAINILRQNQEEISSQFASSGGDPFPNTGFELADNGCPIVPGCLASFECRAEKVFDGGDHHIFLTRVSKIGSDQDGAPLIFFRGRYTQIAP